MLPGQIYVTYKKQRMRLSGIFRCIFTGRPLMWLVAGGEFHLVDFTQQRFIILYGSDTDALAWFLDWKIKNFGMRCRVITGIQDEFTLGRLIESDEQARKSAILHERPVYDLAIYCCRNTFIVPFKLIKNVIQVNND